MSASASTQPKSSQKGTAIEAVNEIRLVGRVSQPPEERLLPSGDTLWSFRVVVPRPDDPARERSQVDAVDCRVWSGRVRRSVANWRVDDVVEVSGSVRRRFFRTAQGAAASRFEVEVSAGRVIRRASSA
jgi:single-strand DNA-binding protein